MIKPYQALATDYDGLRQYGHGCSALLNNTIGFENIALAIDAGASLTTGNYNIDIGNAGVASEINTMHTGTSAQQTNTYIAGGSGVTARKLR